MSRDGDPGETRKAILGAGLVALASSVVDFRASESVIESSCIFVAIAYATLCLVNSMGRGGIGDPYYPLAFAAAVFGSFAARIDWAIGASLLEAGAVAISAGLGTFVAFRPALSQE